ncbi:PREDICTED: uncharacterized mitochondrial protein AtMg00810-like [Brassica oleracea var. oleracea]|uniref:uncharacterized mitochondrial protein AtMg00810-like n=1 Tax=Brassica oleracea var. oleracea TaxID=109376 RepID=UPI0006A6BC40|nr:PREDICTED: uncharacterized mitochondrial protein AtMg00810-like [Brassica oleracea var. oleracea]
MQDAKAVATPMASSPRLTRSGTQHSNPKEFRQLVGSLQYLSFTRPDVAYAVNKLSQFMQFPTCDHWQAAKRVLRYLAGTATHGLFISRSTNLTVHVFTDADWAGDPSDYISTNGYIVYLGDQPISWSSRKQKGIARSSTEAEYRSIANTASEVRWHLALDYHYIREQVQAGQLRIAHISTHDQLADGLTKPLTRSQFPATRHKIGVSQPPPS